LSIARHHAEWLSLVPVSGPFLSLPVLMEAFNTGLEPHDPDQSRLLRQEYANWQDSFEKRKADPAPHQHWIKFVLTKTLELDDRVLAEGQAIRPIFVSDSANRALTSILASVCECGRCAGAGSKSIETVT
jgi:hypothetical protein